MPVTEFHLPQTLSIHTEPYRVGLQKVTRSREEPTLFALHKDVHELAGYEFTQPAVPRDNFLIIHAKRPGKRGTRVVMKMPLSSDEFLKEMLEREFMLMQAARGVTPFVPEVFGAISVPLYVNKAKVGTTEAVKGAKVHEYPLLIMRELAGGDFADQLRVRGSYMPSRLRKKMEAPASAIDAINQQLNIVHRDIKTSNLVGRQLHVVDFGVAVKNSEIVNGYSGTPGFSPIEFYATNVNLTNAADVFSFGVTVAAGRGITLLPRSIESIKRVLFNEKEYEENLGAKFGHLRVAEQDVFRKAVARHPAHRYDSCTDMLADYARAMQRPQKTVIYASGK